MKRRNFLKIGAATVTGGLLASCGQTDGSNPDNTDSDTPASNNEGNIIPATNNRTYFITEGFITQPDSKSVYFRGFSQSELSLNVPAQPFLVIQGDTVTITINNTLSTEHSFVIDGVVNSGVIAAGESKTFSFVAEKAGSFLFYDNLNTPFNRLSGLHGGMAVMPVNSTNELYENSPTFKQQYFWLINDIDPIWHDNFRNSVIPQTKFIPAYFTINGLSMRVPGHPDYKNANIDSGYAPQTRIVGSIGERALIRTLHAGLCTHSMHWHANHVEWLTKNGKIRDDIWEKDTVLLPGNKGQIDVIYPFDPPPNAFPAVTKGHYPMHFHDETTQTAGGGLYQFGVATTIEFK